MVVLRGVLAGAVALATANVSSAEAQGGDLAQQAQNPIANLISVPFQNNTNFNVGPFGMRSTSLTNSGAKPSNFAGP